MTGFEPYPRARDGVSDGVRPFRWSVALAGLASALPLLLPPGDQRADEVVENAVFAVGLMVATLFPFALLIALGGRLSEVARWLCLALLVGFEALAYYEVFRPTQSDGQAGLIFLFLPFYLTALVLLVSATDILGRAVARRIQR